MNNSSSPLIVFLCYMRGIGLLHNLADWLTALIAQTGEDFQLIGLSQQGEQENGLYHRLLRRSALPIQIARSLDDPDAEEILSRAEIVHCHGFRQLEELHRLKRKKKLTFKCILSVHYFKNGTPWKTLFTNLASATLLNKAADMLHFLSVRSHEEFKSGNLLMKRKLPYHIFPLGCDETEFMAINWKKEPASWDFIDRLASDQPKICYLANFNHNKQHRWLIDAVAPLLLRRNAVLWLLGDGPELLRIKDYVQERSLSDHIIFPGRIYRSFVPWLLSYMHVAVCVSNSENSPHAIMEPLFAGVPVVTYDVGTASQLVSDFSRGFILGKPRVKEEFARKLDIVLSNPSLQRQMAENARVYARQFYTWNVCASNTLAMYRTMLPGRIPCISSK